MPNIGYQNAIDALNSGTLSEATHEGLYQKVKEFEERCPHRISSDSPTQKEGNPNVSTHTD
jgi:hypothetical protein